MHPYATLRHPAFAGCLVVILLAVLFLGGPAPIGAQGTPQRITDGLQVLYTFEEGSGTIVNDVSAVGTPLNLHAGDEAALTWSAEGLTFDVPTLLVSADPATKILQAVQSTNEITFEAWITPANTTQDGPARIMSMSDDIYNSNFTLGQGLWGSYPTTVYDARLRTATTSPNGQPSLSSPSGAVTTALTHVVYTRDARNMAHLYVNGVEVASHTVGGNFDNWDASYPLILGNELTLNRPWLGTFRLAAVYNRALTPTQVAQNFNAGGRITAPIAPPTDVPPTTAPLASAPLGPVVPGLQVLYTFDEGSGTIIHDTAGVGTPLDLTAIDGTAITWYPGALEVHAATILASSQPATRLAQAMQASNAITVEAWIVPGNTTQNGPARIVSNSNDIYNSNFTLGQGLWGSYPTDLYTMRLRTGTTDASGQPSVNSPPHSATSALTHVVYTRDANNTARLYVDGQQVTQQTLGGGFLTWDPNYPLMLANELSMNRPWLGTFYRVASITKP